MKKEQKIIYYSNELEDEFAEDNIVPKKIDESYRYLREDFLGRVRHIFWYRIVAIPLAFIYLKLYFRHKIVNREKLKVAKKEGYFMYGNHTHFMADALIPTIVNTPKQVNVIVNPNNVSMPVLGKITPSLGALPLPDDAGAAKNFLHALEYKIQKKKCVFVYPEAHIWPYYTKIRPFKDTSFRYPVTYNTPVYSLTNTYQKRRFSKRPRIVTYIDGPFYPDESLNAKERRKKLRDTVYEQMTKCAKNNNVEMVKYIKKEKKENNIG